MTAKVKCLDFYSFVRYNVHIIKLEVKDDKY